MLIILHLPVQLILLQIINFIQDFVIYHNFINIFLSRVGNLSDRFSNSLIGSIILSSILQKIVQRIVFGQQYHFNILQQKALLKYC